MITPNKDIAFLRSISYKCYVRTLCECSAELFFYFAVRFFVFQKTVRVLYTDIYFRLHETFYNDGS